MTTHACPHPHLTQRRLRRCRRYQRPRCPQRRLADANLIAGGGRVFGWTAWNMPDSLIQGSQSSTWAYGPEHERYKLATDGRTTWYLNPDVHQGNHYEQTRYSSGTVEHRTTLYGGGRPIGEYISYDSGGSPQTRYFHSDGQGSINAVTDAAGAVVTRYKYDPWGKQTVIAGSNTGIDQTRQGHTGHEMLDGGLTHMNGRLYDPSLARFASADPYVDNAYDLQGLNRYSYALNNPLTYTDPSGFSAWTDFRDGFLKPVVSIVAAAYLGPMAFQAGFWGVGATVGSLTGSGLLGYGAGMLAGASLAGATTSLVTTGSTRNWQQNAISAGLFSGVGDLGYSAGSFENAMAHGVAGGLASSAWGGDFKSGFMSGAFAEWAGPNILEGMNGPVFGTIKYAVLGGTASAIGGGKFANGARTGAFGYLFNQCASAKCTFLEKTKAFFRGTWSVATGTGNSIRFVARGTGLMGSDEQMRWSQEGEGVDKFVEQYRTDSEFNLHRGVSWDAYPRYWIHSQFGLISHPSNVSNPSP